MLLFPAFKIFQSQAIVRIGPASLLNVYNHKRRYEILQPNLVNRRLSGFKVIRSIQVCSQVFRRGECTRVDPISFQCGQYFKMKRRVSLAWPIGVLLIQGIAQIHDLNLAAGNLG